MANYRTATADDRRFVVASWSSSYKNAHAAGIISSEDWPAIMHGQLTKLLDRPGTRTIVAYDPPSALYGFISGDVTHTVPVVYYCYVKAPYRSQEQPDGRRSGPRHARGLFTALGIDPESAFIYTCRTPLVPQFHAKIPRARFVPAAARYANHQEYEEQLR